MTSETATGRPTETLAPGRSILIGVVGAIVGLLPWLATGARMPVQNIWDSSGPPEHMPLTLMPLSQYHVVSAVALVVVGSGIAGIVVRWSAARGKHAQRWWVWAGAAIVQVVALTQASVALHSGLESTTRAQIYLWGMVAGVAVGIGVGCAVLFGMASRSVPATTVAVTFAALALMHWLPVLLRSLTGANLSTYSILRVGQSASIWIPALIIGAVVGWCGARNVRRTAAAIAALVSLWVVPSLVSAFEYAVGTGVYLQYPGELLPAGGRVFVESLTGSWPAQRMLIATMVAVLVAIVMRSIRELPDHARKSETG